MKPLTSFLKIFFLQISLAFTSAIFCFRLRMIIFYSCVTFQSYNSDAFNLIKSPCWVFDNWLFNKSLCFFLASVNCDSNRSLLGYDFNIASILLAIARSLTYFLQMAFPKSSWQKETFFISSLCKKSIFDYLRFLVLLKFIARWSESLLIVLFGKNPSWVELNFI